jgi:hypothetical protein
MLKSCIKSGIAGSTIVSPYIVIRPRQLRIARVIHAERLMWVCSSTPVITLYAPSISWDYVRNSRGRKYADKSSHCKKTRRFPYVGVFVCIVMNQETYPEIIRFVESIDAMTADWSRLIKFHNFIECTQFASKSPCHVLLLQ